MLSIFGLGSSKFKVGSTTVTIPYTRLYPVLSEHLYQEEESIINGERTIEHYWRHNEFRIWWLLFKINPISTRKTNFNTVISYIGQNIDEFYPKVDGAVLGDGLGKPLKNASSTLVKVNFIDYKYSPFDDGFNQYDAFDLYFRTINPNPDITKLVQ